MCELCSGPIRRDEKVQVTVEARNALRKKLMALGDFEKMPDEEWGGFVNALPREEFLALIEMGT